VEILTILPSPALIPELTFPKENTNSIPGRLAPLPSKNPCTLKFYWILPTLMKKHPAIAGLTLIFLVLMPIFIALINPSQTRAIWKNTSTSPSGW